MRDLSCSIARVTATELQRPGQQRRGVALLVRRSARSGSTASAVTTPAQPLVRRLLSSCVHPLAPARPPPPYRRASAISLYTAACRRAVNDSGPSASKPGPSSAGRCTASFSTSRSTRTTGVGEVGGAYRRRGRRRCLRLPAPRCACGWATAAIPRDPIAMHEPLVHKPSQRSRSTAYSWSRSARSLIRPRSARRRPARRAGPSLVLRS